MLKEHRDEGIMSFDQGPGWWQASGDQWYSAESHPDYPAPAQPQELVASTAFQNELSGP